MHIDHFAIRFIVELILVASLKECFADLLIGSRADLKNGVAMGRPHFTAPADNPAPAQATYPKAGIEPATGGRLRVLPTIGIFGLRSQRDGRTLPPLSASPPVGFEPTSSGFGDRCSAN